MTANGDQLMIGIGSGPVFEVVKKGGAAPLCLVCEHASARIPPALQNLGLAAADRLSHAVWDPGAEALARRLSLTFDAPLVLSRISRLVIDCNRPPTRPDAVPHTVERITVPGNRGLTDAARAARIAEVYDPFHACVAETLEGFSAPPALVTIHSFAPVWHGERRMAEIGLLHDADPGLAKRMMCAAAGPFDVALNVPYSQADGVTHLLQQHGTARGLKCAMIEVRNDLLATESGVERVAEAIAPMLRAACLNREAAP